MALKSPLVPSPTAGLMSAFSPYTDSPSSPAAFNSILQPNSNRSSGRSDLLHPPPSPYPTYVDPSPVDSNGTENTEVTEIDDMEQEGAEEEEAMPPDIELTTAGADGDTRPKLDTNLVTRVRADSGDEAPQSVIHAPPGFKNFDVEQPESRRSRDAQSETGGSESTVVTASKLRDGEDDENEQLGGFAPINTSVPPARGIDRGTPRAQTRQEAEEEHKRRSRASPSLEDIPEARDLEKASNDESEDGQGVELMANLTRDHLDQAEAEIKALKTALAECWTLCNTLSGLSSVHRERMFSSGHREVQEQAWRSCWKLCQQLYENRDEDPAGEVRPTLELCRDFCQALFEARHRLDEAADSVLRVSFELNNHLYNTHDRNLPEAFRERTLDFYVTLCHRLMKQRVQLPDESDALLRACWGLAEMLFNIRQNNREGKPPDEELLGSAVQACWELCDIFREGWNQVRPDRGTPRPSQSTFPMNYSQSVLSGQSSSMDDSYHSANSLNSLNSLGSLNSLRSLPPETPTTIFDEPAESPVHEPNVPNILVLGPDQGGMRAKARWSSSASTLSTYSESSQRTSSTATANAEDAHLVRLKVLVLKAAMNSGYARNGAQGLAAFVKTLPSNSFGTLGWQVKLLESYKKLVQADATLRTSASLPSRRVTAIDVGRAVQWFSRTEQFAWLRDLYRLVFGFFPEDANVRVNVSIQT